MKMGPLGLGSARTAYEPRTSESATLQPDVRCGTTPGTRSRIANKPLTAEAFRAKIEAMQCSLYNLAFKVGDPKLFRPSSTRCQGVVRLYELHGVKE